MAWTGRSDAVFNGTGEAIHHEINNRELAAA